MTSTRTYFKSFTGGEVSPFVYGRLDFDKYQTGLALAENFDVRPEGPIQTRAGFKFVAHTKFVGQYVRLIDFVYNDQTTAVLEFGNNYMRVLQNGAYVTRAAIVVSSIAGNVVTLGGPHGMSTGHAVLMGGRYYRVTVTGANTFTTQQPFPPYSNVNPTGTTAAPVFEVVSPYGVSDLADIHYVQSADVMTLTHLNVPPYELRRTDATTPVWTFAAITSVNTALAPVAFTKVRPTAVAGGTVTRKMYKVTALSSTGEEGLATPELFANQDPPVSITAVTTGPSTVVEFGAAGNAVDLATSGGDDAIAYFRTQPGGITGLPSSPTPVALRRLTSTTFLVLTYPELASVATSGTYTSGGSITFYGAYLDLNLAGSAVDVEWQTVNASPVSYNVYKSEHGGPYGYIGNTPALPGGAGVATGFRDNNITPDISRQPPISVAYPFASAGNYPQAVGYFQQRRVFGGTANNPQTVWMTRTGTESNFNVSAITQDSDALTFRVASTRPSLIRHFASLGDLLALTSDVDYKIDAANGGAISPTNLNVRAESYTGSANIVPALPGDLLVYAANRGGRLFELAFNWQTQAYAAGDISLVASHLFDGYLPRGLATARAPTTAVYSLQGTVASPFYSGTVLRCTYLPEQQVRAWTQMVINDAIVLSACAIPEGAEDRLYIVTRRTVNGQEVQMIERQEPRAFTSLANSYCVDCGMTYNGTPATTISGLYWLEGETVSVLADGGVVTPKVVSGGAITLSEAASVVHVGLPFTARFQTLPLSMEIAALGQTNVKNINKVYLRLKDSAGVYAGPSFDKLTLVKQPPPAVYNLPTGVLDGICPVNITPTWQEDGQVCVQIADPLPATVTSFGLELAVGG